MGIQTESLFRRVRSHKNEPALPAADAPPPGLSACDGRLPRCERQASFKRGVIYAVDSIALSPFR